MPLVPSTLLEGFAVTCGGRPSPLLGSKRLGSGAGDIVIAIKLRRDM